MRAPPARPPPVTDGSSFSGLFTRVEIGHMRISLAAERQWSEPQVLTKCKSTR